MTVQVYLVPVIDGGAAHRALAEREAGTADDVQGRAGGHTQANDIAGVGRDFRFQQCDVKHDAPIEKQPRFFPR